MRYHASIRFASLLVLVMLLSLSLPQASLAGKGSLMPANQDIRWYKSILDSQDDTGNYVSITYDPDTGTPWVSYYDSPGGNLKVAHYSGFSSGNCGPKNSWTCTTIDQANDVGRYSSIDIFPNNSSDPLFSTLRVGISYADITNRALRYAEYAYKQVGGWAWRFEQVDSTMNTGDSVGTYTSFKYDSNGIPHIAYYASHQTAPYSVLLYASRVGNSGGNCGNSLNWNCDPVESSTSFAPFPGRYASLDISWLDRPYISYFESGNGFLKYAWLSHPSGGGNCGPQSTWTCQMVDGSSVVGKFTSIHAPHRLINDPAQIAYYDAPHGRLKYAHAVSSGGNCGIGNNWQCDNITAIGVGLSQAGISLIVDQSYKPIIAYMDASEDLAPFSLHIAYPKAYGNCGPETPYATWQCILIDGGGANADEASFVSIAMSPSGLISIAYPELNKYAYPNVTHLKIAYQQALVYLPTIMK